MDNKNSARQIVMTPSLAHDLMARQCRGHKGYARILEAALYYVVDDEVSCKVSLLDDGRLICDLTIRGMLEKATTLAEFVMQITCPDDGPVFDSCSVTIRDYIVATRP
jgi:hypothetical protein